MADVQQQPASTPAFTVKVNGSSLAPEVRGMVTRIVVSGSVDKPATFELELDNWDRDEQRVRWSDASLFDPGGVVAIEMGYEERVAKVIEGEITGLELRFPERARALLSVRGYDRLHRFRRGRRTRSYLQVKDSDIATQIAGDNGLSADVETSVEVHPYLLQTNQTDIDFLLERARAIGYELLIDQGKLIFRKSKHDRGKTVTLDFAHGLMTFDAYLSTAGQVSGVTVRGWDPSAKKELVGKAQAGDVSGTMNGTKVGPKAADDQFGAHTLTIVQQPVTTQNEADLLAKGVLDELALTYLVAHATIVGNPDVQAGSVVEVGGAGSRFSGFYYVREVTHAWSGAFTTELELRRNAA